MLEKILLDYLTYSDIEQLRNSCVFLHNFTRELRLTYRIFPLERRPIYNKIISLFLKWARVGKDGMPTLANYEIKDKYNQSICKYHLQLLCHLTSNNCNASHHEIFINRKELEMSGAYIVEDELMFFIAEIFQPKMLWKLEVFIKELFQAYSHVEWTLYRKVQQSVLLLVCIEVCHAFVVRLLSVFLRFSD
jgi:hypothetical protein